MLLEEKHNCFPIHSTHDTSDAKCVHFFPHTDQFSDTSWVSYNSVQFRYCLPGDSIRSQRLRAQSHKTAPTSDTSLQAQTSCSFFFLKSFYFYFILFIFLAVPCGLWDLSSLTRV